MLICDPTDPSSFNKILEWLREHEVRTLNVAGPSEMTQRGIGQTSYALLRRLLQNSSETGSTTLALLSATLLVATMTVAALILNVRIVAGKLFLGSSVARSEAIVDAVAAFQTSKTWLAKGEEVILMPEGRVHIAMDHANNLTAAVKGLIVQQSSKLLPTLLRDRYPSPELNEDLVFYRDWSGPAGEQVFSDLLEETKLRKDIPWGALLAAVLPRPVSARSDPLEVLEGFSMGPQDLVPIPGETRLKASRDGFLTFIINEAILSPHSNSSDSRRYYEILKAASTSLTNDVRHQIPIQSIPLIWYADNNGSFRILIDP